MKQINYQQVILVILIGIAFCFSSCRKQYDNPPMDVIAEGNSITIAQLKAMYTGTDLSIAEDYNIFANVTSEETDGNFYKEAYIQDGTGAIRLRLVASGGLYIGDSIRINLNGTVLSDYNGMIQLDSVDVDNNIVKQATQKFIQPSTYNIDQISAALQGYLVELNDVEFISDELGYTYANSINQQSENRTLTDCSGNTILVRTSGYANFATSVIPDGNGSIIAIVGVFGNDIQLYIRDINEVQLTEARCDTTSGGGGGGGGGSGNIILENDFSSNDIVAGGWTQHDVFGGVNWTTSDQGSSGNFYAKATNTSSQISCETWLISPDVDLSNTVNPILNFRSATFTSNSDLKILISTNYDGTSSPSIANWTQLSATLSSGSWSWEDSGDISLNAYLQNNIYIAYQYTGTTNDFTTWEIDDVIIQEQ
mgnify:CR=1 FL=1